MHAEPLNGAGRTRSAKVCKAEKEMGEGGDPLKDGKEGEEKVPKKVTIAAVGLICPLNGPTMSWAKFFSLSKK